MRFGVVRSGSGAVTKWCGAGAVRCEVVQLGIHVICFHDGMAYFEA